MSLVLEDNQLITYRSKQANEAVCKSLVWTTDYMDTSKALHLFTIILTVLNRKLNPEIQNSCFNLLQCPPD